MTDRHTHNRHTMTAYRPTALAWRGAVKTGHSEETANTKVLKEHDINHDFSFSSAFNDRQNLVRIFRVRKLNECNMTAKVLRDNDMSSHSTRIALQV